MASTSEIYSKNFDNNTPLEVNIPPAPLSGVKTEADTGSNLTTCTTQASRQVSSIYKHTRTAIKEEKARTKKRYFCKYYPP